MNERRGFTLIELMVSIAIMGMVLAALVPMLMNRRSFELERKAVIDELNQLVQTGWQEALFTDKIVKVEFDLPQHKVVLAQATGKKDLLGEEEFIPIDDPYVESSMAWPSDYEIRQVFIDGRLQQGKEVIWFFIVPGGLSQRVIINAIDQKSSEQADEPVQFSLVINPFYVQFKELMQFQQP